jgi:hypothetical protein
MKKYKAAILSFLLISIVASCKKDPSYVDQRPPRTIRFVLFTEKDFANDEHNITFSLVIRSHSQVLFDSSIGTMKIKDIPKIENKLVFDKIVPNDDHSDLAAGFDYTIQNVGSSWFIDTVKASALSKTITYSFQ